MTESLHRVGQDPYIELLKKVLLGVHNPGVGMRMAYLLKCLGTPVPSRSNPPTDSGGHPRLDLDYFVNIEQREPDLRNDVINDDISSWWDKVLGFPMSMTSFPRLNNVETAVRTVHEEAIPGDFLETGVWRGGVGILVRALYKQLEDKVRVVWMADSYQGMPEAEPHHGDPDDLTENWMLPQSLDIVRSNFESFDLLDDRVQFLQGWFEDTMPAAPIDKLSILRLDGDHYSSTLDVLNPMYDLLSSGGFVLVDDYGAYEACRRAVHDFLDSRNEAPEIVHVDWTGSYWRKP